MLACCSARRLKGEEEREKKEKKVDLQGRASIVRLLLSSNANVSLRDGAGITAVHYAAGACNLEILQQLVDAGADFTAVDGLKRNSIHHFAGASGHSLKADDLNKVLQLLVKHCGPDAQNAWGVSNASARPWNTSSIHKCVHTPISLAMYDRRWKIFKALRESGAIMRTTYDLKYFLRYAVDDLQPAAVRLLVEQGVLLTPDDSILSYIPLEKSPSFLETFSPILKDLVAIGLDTNKTQYGGWTFLLRVAEKMNSRELVQQLLDAGSDPYRTNQDGLDSFLLASLQGNLDTLHCLLDHAVEHPKEGHRTERFSSIESAENSKLIQILCSALQQCDLVDEDKASQTLLQRAAEIGNNEMVKQLVAHGAKVEISDNWGWTPLHMAAFHGYEDVIRSLLEAGANVCAAIKEWNDNKVSIVGGPSLEGWAGIPSISQRLWDGNPWRSSYSPTAQMSMQAPELTTQSTRDLDRLRYV